jgi:signal transduction histidine kinase
MNKDKQVQPLFLRAYDDLFRFIAKERIRKGDTDLREIHAHIIAVFSTGLLMWTYAFIAVFAIDNPVPGYVGILTSLVHLHSPLLYRFSKNTFLICSIMLLSGVIHQSTFSFYSGGFTSLILIWLSVIPLLAGIIIGRKGITFWAISVLSLATIFLGLELAGYQYPNLISANGELLARTVMVFGYILLTTVVITLHTSMHEAFESKLLNERDRVKNLVRVLSHDLSNPILIIENYIKRIIGTLDEDELAGKYASKVSTSVKAMKDISSSVRRMQAAEEGKFSLNIEPTSLNECVDYIKFLLEDSLELKNIKVVYDYEKNKDRYVYVDPVVFKNQVLANVLSNSIKFSDPGSSIEIKITPSETGWIEMHITDNGVGMSEDLLSGLFSIDKPTSRKGTKGESGTGYGMMIVKSFMDRFEGNIQIKSTEKTPHCKDHGTIVTLTLLESQTNELPQ